MAGGTGLVYSGAALRGKGKRPVPLPPRVSDRHA